MNTRQLTEFTRTCPFTRRENKMQIRVIHADYLSWIDGGKTIQEAMPYLTPDEQEFLMTGITPENWEKYVVGEDKEL